jgi:N-acyl-D-amino-acid deacylase
MHDVVIRNGWIVDGTGEARRRGDVAVDGNRVSAVGDVAGRGRNEIDAEGHAVTPGFIDGHTHLDAQLFWDPLCTSSCWHGITTAVMGNCGFTLAPASAAQRPLVERNLERAEDISAAAMQAGIEWRWAGFREYLDVVDRLPKGINIAANIGHSALRTYVMGERAFEQAATADDLTAMDKELRDALRAGAIGFTTSRGQHMTADGRPVASRLAAWDEIRQLVNALGDERRGIFEIALDPATRSSDETARDKSLQDLKALALDSRAPVTFGVAEATGWREQLRTIDETVAAGGRMFGQSHSRGASIISSFETRLPFDALPRWKPFRAMPLERQLAALGNASLRRELVEDARQGTYNEAFGADLRPPEYDRMYVLSHAVPPHPTVAEQAKAQGLDPVELILSLALASGLKQMFLQAVTPQDPETLFAIMQHPRTVMTFSDAGAHVSQIMDASIQTHLLAYWVRKRQSFTFERAIHMITQAPATAWGFSDRGLIRPGYIADINILDERTVEPDLPTVEHDLPSGAVRLVQKAKGFLATLVGGQILFRDGRHTGALPGRLLRAGIHERQP